MIDALTLIKNVQSSSLAFPVRDGQVGVEQEGDVRVALTGVH